MAIDLDRETAEVAMDMFGENILYEGAEQRAIVSVETVELSGYERTVEQRMTISILTPEFPTIVPGAQVEVRGRSYVVDQQLDAGGDPSIMAKLVLR